MDIGKQIGEEIGKTLNENINSIIALFPGKMKPPHKGHFTVVKEACKIADEVVVIISQKYKDEFGPEQSKRIWEQYKKFLPENVSIQIAKTASPVADIYEIIKDKSSDYLVVYGKGEESRYESIINNKEKYNNVEVVNGGNFENIHSTDLREAIRKRNLNQIQTFLPEGIQADKFMYNFSVHEGKYHDKLVAMAKRKDPNAITPLGKEYLPKTESIMGGLADHITVEDLAQMHKVSLSQILSQLNKGVKVEMEHTNNPDVAHEIALDHIYEDPQYYDKLATIELEEGKQVGTLYHFTKISNVDSIIKGNELNGVQIDVNSKIDRDARFFRQEKDTESHTENEYFISFTRDKLLYKKNPNIGGSSARMVFDGNKLSNNNQIKPFFYYKDEYDDHNDRDKQNESEERLVLKGNRLSNVNNFIKEIHIILDVIMDSHYLQDAKKLNGNSLVKFYWKEKEVDFDEWMDTEFQKIEPYGDEINESKILKEIYTEEKKPLIDKLVAYCCDNLNIDAPDIKLIDDEDYSQNQSSFGGYSPTDKRIYVVTKNRHTADIMRTLAHEIFHHKQNINGELGIGAGKTGDKWENEANSYAGIVLRNFGKEYPEIYS